MYHLNYPLRDAVGSVSSATVPTHLAQVRSVVHCRHDTLGTFLTHFYSLVDHEAC